MTTAPRQLTTDRLVLHAPLESDRIAFLRYCDSPRRVAQRGQRPEAESSARFDAYRAHWAEHGFGRYVLHLEGRAVGLVGLSQYPNDVELSWYLWYGDQEGTGLATEAASAVLGMARETLRLPPVASYIHPGNTRSVALATRLGAVLEPGEIGVDFLAAHQIYRHRNQEAA